LNPHVPAETDSQNRLQSDVELDADDPDPAEPEPTDEADVSIAL
jgi:hypothetical protein